MDLPEHHAEKISSLSDFDLDFAIREMTLAVIEDPSDASEVVYYAEMIREWQRRQAKAKVRLSEYFRQRAIEQERNSRTGKKPSNDVIDVIHEDRYSVRVGLRYSDIEKLVPWAERDTKKAFMEEQARRLRLILDSDVKLSDKQTMVLEHVSSSESRVSTSAKYGTSYGPLDGRVVNGLVTRGLLEYWGFGSSAFDRQSMLIIADITKPKTEK